MVRSSNSLTQYFTVLSRPLRFRARYPILFMGWFIVSYRIVASATIAALCRYAILPNDFGFFWLRVMLYVRTYDQVRMYRCDVLRIRALPRLFATRGKR